MGGQQEPVLTTEAFPRNTLARLLDGHWHSIGISVAAKLGIADLLTDGPRDSDELARACRANPGALYRLLRALASVGVFAEVDERRFALTPVAELLRTGTAGTMRAWAILLGDLWWRPWGELLYSVRTGRPAFDHVYGFGYFEYLARNPELGVLYNETMASAARLAAESVLSAYDFSRTSTIVDVGGGYGALIAAILKANPHMRGVLFDLPPVIEGAKRLIEAEGVGERCDLIAGDFLESVPRGGDAYVLRYILHDWDDARATAILQNCHTAMHAGGKVLVLEQLIRPGNEPSANKFNDLRALVLYAGRERTEAEYLALLTSAGFGTAQVTRTPALFSIIEGVRR